MAEQRPTWGGKCTGADDVKHLELKSCPFRDLSSSLAKAIAEGDACPISLESMVDKCPGYNSGKKAKLLPLEPQSQNTPFKASMKGKRKRNEDVQLGSIRSFFSKYNLDSLLRNTTDCLQIPLRFRQPRKLLIQRSFHRSSLCLLAEQAERGHWSI